MTAEHTHIMLIYCDRSLTPCCLAYEGFQRSMLEECREAAARAGWENYETEVGGQERWCCPECGKSRKERRQRKLA